jgi:putative hydrolase of the HAD superfamily
MVIKEVIFDCFGVLTQDGWTKFLKLYATDDSRQELSDLNHSVDAGIIGAESFFNKVSQVTGAEKDEIITILVKSYHPEEEVFKFIKELKKNYKVGLISNISSPIEDYLPKEYVSGLFDEETLSYQAGVIKPSKKIFEIHLSKTGIEPNEAVFIDDREVNAQGARDAGLHGIWYKNIDQLKVELKSLGVKFNE